MKTTRTNPQTNVHAEAPGHAQAPDHAKAPERISARACVRFTLCLLAAVLLFIAPLPVQASEPTDEILNFTITVDVNDDATLDMNYHIEWLVLDSDSLGPLTWIDLGMPNRNYSDLTALSDSIDSISENGNKIQIYLDKEYYEGDTAVVDFSFTQGNVYQIDKYTDGETVYSFTPAWFDAIEVDQMIIRWSGDQAVSWEPECNMEEDDLVWYASLFSGERFTIEVSYPNDAYVFTEEGSVKGLEGAYDDWDYDDYDDDTGSSGIKDFFIVITGLFVIICFMVVPFVLIGRIFKWVAAFGRGFGTEKTTEKQIVRTKVEYYETCPNCGAPHEGEKETCEYCGSSMIKHKEVVEEKNIVHPERYSKAGSYRYIGTPNTYIHVNVIDVPRSVSSRISSAAKSARTAVHTTSKSSSGSRSSGSRSSGSSGRSSGGRSSCACASHCACASSCACACACASSGRAGCSVKNFFDEDRHNRTYTVDAKAHD